MRASCTQSYTITGAENGVAVRLVMAPHRLAPEANAPRSKLPGILVCMRASCTQSYTITKAAKNGGARSSSDGPKTCNEGSPCSPRREGLHVRKLHSIIHNHEGGGEWWRPVFV